jgi:DNA mismatch repair protein MutL
VIDIITLLPDNIANQIAAGEVIQRPASAVKELLENAVDADATSIQLHITDAGKTLIQVIDNGKGMSETDARMSFERHATSKIKNIDDLFHIRTMGFRGEALASIAAVSMVELKTRRAEDELGTLLEIDNSFVRKQEACACAVGTNLCMKNLFFNVPARRNFLKSNAAELRHIIDEFIHVALAFPNIFFSLTSNNQQVFYLEAGSHKQRFLQLLGNQYSTKLVTVKETTDYLNVNGFVAKPEAAKKTRGDQYFFVNNRFIKSAYLNHAVVSAFDALLPKDSFPVYALYIDLDPSQVDINVHPTKQEIKFEDEKIVYAFVQAAIKHALAQFSIAPSLDFTLNADIMQTEAISQPFTEEKKEMVTASELYKKFSQKNQAHFIEPSIKNELKQWKDFYTDATQMADNIQTPVFSFHQSNPVQQGMRLITDAPFYQLHKTYIVAPLENGFLIVHQQHAHERILFEKYLTDMQNSQSATQQNLFPATLELSPQDGALLQELLPDLELLGYKIELFGKYSFIIQGVPADVLQGNEKHSVELLIEQFKHFSNELNFSRRQKLIHCMARQQSIKAGQSLTDKEMKALLSELVTCGIPSVSPSGNPVFVEFNDEQLMKMFGK